MPPFEEHEESLIDGLAEHHEQVQFLDGVEVFLEKRSYLHSIICSVIWGEEGLSPDPRTTGGSGSSSCRIWVNWAASSLSNTSENWSEQKAADVLLERLSGSALVIGDGEYDVSRLHDLAASHDSGLLTPPPPEAKSTGHHYQSRHRKHGLALARSSIGVVLLMSRIGIEQSFGNLTSFGDGLGPLPTWVRRPPRVVVWVATQLLINLDRQIQLRQRYEQLPNAA